MPQKPPAPNPAPPLQDADAPEYIFAMHRWRYPRHHGCGHWRGYLNAEPTRCASCIADDKRTDRRRAARAAFACLLAFLVTITLMGSCAAGGAR